MDSPEEPTAEAKIESFLGEATHDLEDWLWDRQRTFNQVLLAHLQKLQFLRGKVDRLEASFDDLGSDLQKVQKEILADLRSVQRELIKNDVSLRDRIEPLEEFKRRGMTDLMHHTDALFARLDQKLDRSRRLVDELKSAAERGRES